jgi:hypothetical protein
MQLLLLFVVPREQSLFFSSSVCFSYSYISCVDMCSSFIISDFSFTSSTCIVKALFWTTISSLHFHFRLLFFHVLCVHKNWGISPQNFQFMITTDGSFSRNSLNSVMLYCRIRIIPELFSQVWRISFKYSVETKKTNWLRFILKQKTRLEKNWCSISRWR